MRLLALLCGIVLFVVGPSLGQSKTTVYVDGGTGISSEPKQFDDFYSAGARVGGGIGYSVSRHAEILLRVHYDALPFDEEGVKDFLIEGGFMRRADAEGTRVDGAGADLLSGSLNLKVNTTIGRRLGFYLAGGFGVYRHDVYGVTANFPDEFAEDTFGFAEQEETNIGFNIGFGLSLPITENVEARFEPQFVFVFSGEGEETAPVLEKTGNISYVPLQVGVAWSP